MFIQARTHIHTLIFTDKHIYVHILVRAHAHKCTQETGTESGGDRQTDRQRGGGGVGGREREREREREQNNERDNSQAVRYFNGEVAGQPIYLTLRRPAPIYLTQSTTILRQVEAQGQLSE